MGEYKNKNQAKFWGFLIVKKVGKYKNFLG